MLSSGNDAAVALAIYCGGTVEGFAEMMNDKARVLGLRETHFVNPHGLDSPGHYSTARDLAVLAAYAMENPVFYKTVSAKTITMGQRCLRNHNKLLWQVEGADGVKPVLPEPLGGFWYPVPPGMAGGWWRLPSMRRTTGRITRFCWRRVFPDSG